MKKISKILGVIACAFVVIFSSVLLTACGQNAPFDVKGTSLQTNGKAFAYWNETVTQETKIELYANWGVKNDAELNQKIIEELETENDLDFKFVFKKDGSVEFSMGNSEPSIYYYVQSEDLEKIETYSNVEHTSLAYIIQFVNGSYCFFMGDNEYYSVYIVFKKV